MAQVAAHQAQFQAANAQIVTVSFGSKKWATVWLQETESPFPFLLDQERAAYDAYGLQSSRLRAWGLANLVYYAKALLQGRKTYGQRGETDQLGGDFVVDANGRIQYAHPSHDPTDRPSVEQLLQVVRAHPATPPNQTSG